MASTASERISRILFDYKFVSGAESRVINSIDRTRGKFRQLAQDAKSVEVPFGGVQRGAQTLSQRLRGTESGIKDTSAAMRDLRRDAEAARKELEKTGAAGGDSSGGLSRRQRGSRLNAIGREIVGVPDIGPSTDIGQALRLLGAAGFTLKEVGLAAGITGPFLIAAAAAFVLFNRAAEQNKQSLEARLRAEENYSRALLDSTTSEATQRLEQLTREREQLELRVATAQQRVNDALNDAQANFGEAGAYLFLNQTGITTLNEDLKDLQGRLIETGAEVGYLTGAIESGQFAANDMREAEDRLREAREQHTTFLRNSAIGAELEGRQQARSMSSEAARTLLSDLQFERESLIRDFGDSSEEANKRIADLGNRITQLQASTIPAIEARENEERAAAYLTEQVKRLTEAEQTYAREAEKLTQIKLEIAEEEAQSAAKLIEIERDLANKTSELERSRGIDLGEAERDASLAREDAVRESGEALEALEIEHKERLAKIAKDANRDLQNAVGERDALAAYQAQQAAAQATEEENAEYDKRRKEINKRLEDTNRDIDRKLKEQQRDINRRYDEQLRSARLAAQEAVRIEKARSAAQLKALNDAYVAQQAVVTQWSNNIAYHTSVVEYMSARIRKAATDLLNSVSKTPSTGPSGGSFTPGGRAFADGGITPVNRMFLVGEKGPELMQLPIPSRVYSNAESKRMMNGGTVININLDGESYRAMSVQETLNIIGRLMKRQGAA